MASIAESCGKWRAIHYGVSSLELPVLLGQVIREAFSGEVIELSSELDASSPNHHSHLTVEENLET